MTIQHLLQGGNYIEKIDGDIGQYRYQYKPKSTYEYVCIHIILLYDTMNHVHNISCMSMRQSTPVLRLDNLLGGGAVGVVLGTKTDSGEEDVTTVSEYVITAEDETSDVTMLDDPTRDGTE